MSLRAEILYDEELIRFRLPDGTPFDVRPL